MANVACKPVGSLLLLAPTGTSAVRLAVVVVSSQEANSLRNQCHWYYFHLGTSKRTRPGANVVREEVGSFLSLASVKTSAPRPMDVVISPQEKMNFLGAALPQRSIKMY